MFTTGSKWFFGLAGVSLLLAAVYGYTTGGSRLGPVTAGWWGSVGDLLGYGILLAVGVIALLLGIVALATRDADADAIAAAAGTDEPPAATPPDRPAYWPVIAAFGACIAAVGIVIEPAVFIAGLVVVGAALLEWMVLAWSDRATGDPASNKALRDRLMRPLEFPFAAVIFVGLFVFGLSRVFLAVPEMGAVVVASAFATVVLVVGAFIAAKPRISPNLTAGVVVVGAVGAVTVGVLFAAVGEREFHEHHEDHPVRENTPRITPGVGMGGEPEGAQVTGEPHEDMGTAGDPTGEDPETPAEHGDLEIGEQTDPGDFPAGEVDAEPGPLAEDEE